MLFGKKEGRLQQLAIGLKKMERRWKSALRDSTNDPPTVKLSSGAPEHLDGLLQVHGPLGDVELVPAALEVPQVPPGTKLRHGLA